MSEYQSIERIPDVPSAIILNEHEYAILREIQRDSLSEPTKAFGEPWFHSRHPSFLGVPVYINRHCLTSHANTPSPPKRKRPKPIPYGPSWVVAVVGAAIAAAITFLWIAQATQ